MIQQPLFKPQTEWLPPEEFPDLSKYDEISIDLETKDPNLNISRGSGSVVGVGEIVGIAVLLETGVVITQLLMKVVATWTEPKF